MIHYRKLLLSGLVSSLFCLNAQASVGVFVGVAPAPQEVVVPPQGFMSCEVISGHYHHGAWIDKHQRCQYSNTPAVWISAHWECHYFQHPHGICSQWSWVNSYWVTPRIAEGPMGPPPEYVEVPPPGYVEGPAYVEAAPVVVGPEVAVGVGFGHHGHHHWR